MSRADRHAIVIGAGIAGLLAARVLAESCTRVTILERDTADPGAVRRGVGQGRHLHGLLDRGRAIIEELYPGCTDELVAAGAQTAEVLVGTRWYIGGSRLAATPTGLTSIIATRPLLESVLRHRTVQLPNVTLRDGIAVRGLVEDGGRITGVRVSSDREPHPNNDFHSAANGALGHPARDGDPRGGATEDESRGAIVDGGEPLGGTVGGQPLGRIASGGALGGIAGEELRGTVAGSGPLGGTADGRPLGGTASGQLLGGIAGGESVGWISEGEIAAADLVVDASGRGSRICEWLRAIGVAAPVEERLEVDLGYASRLYRYSAGQLGGHASVIISTGAEGHGGGAVHVEGDRWLVTLAGMMGDHPPTDDGGFRAYAASLDAPDIHEIVTAAEPLDDAVPYRFRSSMRRRFDRLPVAPAGLIVLGDAQCAFNPLYAQGMTVAALQAVVLRECLRIGLSFDELPARFYTAANEATATAWQLAASSDLRHPRVAGRRGLRTRLTNAYVAQAHRAAHHDPLVARTFMRVAHLVEPPAALLQPALAIRILLRGNGAASVTPADR